MGHEVEEIAPKHISKLNARNRANKAQANCRKNKFKFGIQVPEEITHAFTLDKASGATLLEDQIIEELAEISECNIFKPLSRGQCPPPGYNRRPCLFVRRKHA